MLQTPCQKSGDALHLRLRVQPGASRDELVGIHGNAIRIRLKAPPVDGRANKALVLFLAGQFDVPRSDVELVHGRACRDKVARIVSPGRIPAFLDEFLKN
jgi:uncharacterized protein (TIGR00251 family)